MYVAAACGKVFALSWQIILVNICVISIIMLLRFVQLRFCLIRFIGCGCYG